MKTKARMIRSGFRVMGRHRVRTLFMILGITIGITALVLTLALGQSVQAKLMESVEKLFSASNIVVTAGAGQMTSSVQRSGATSLKLDDIEAILDEIENVILADAMQVSDGREVKYMENSVISLIVGHSVEGETVWNRTVTHGEFFNEADIASAARVALLGPKVATALFGHSNPVGEQIRIGSVPCRVLGVLEPMGVDPHGSDMDEQIWVPITTMLRRIINKDYIMLTKLEVADRSQMDRTVIQIRELLRERHSLGPDEIDDFHVVTPEQVRKMAAAMTRVFTLFLPLIAGLSLLVGGIIVLNLMLISVKERSTEIGLRKAVGARSKDILQQFLAETTVITVIGGFAGLLLGIIGSMGISAMMGNPPVFPFVPILIGVILSGAIGFVAGVLPARRAADLEPVETLR